MVGLTLTTEEPLTQAAEDVWVVRCPDGLAVIGPLRRARWAPGRAIPDTAIHAVSGELRGALPRITRMGWSKTVTLFRADHGRAPVLLQLRHPLSTWDIETRSPPNLVFPGEGAYLNYSTIVELRGLEPLTLTLPV